MCNSALTTTLVIGRPSRPQVALFVPITVVVEGVGKWRLWPGSRKELDLSDGTYVITAHLPLSRRETALKVLLSRSATPPIVSASYPLGGMFRKNHVSLTRED